MSSAGARLCSGTGERKEGAALREREISRATLGRIPAYLRYLKSLPPQVQNISATAIARQLGLGEVQVRKDLGVLCGTGKPKIGYLTAELIASLESFLDCRNGGTVIVGAGKLGRALLDYGGFADYGLSLLAAFDIAVQQPETSATGKPILPMEALDDFCRRQDVRLGIIAVPAAAAQEVCNRLCAAGVGALWSFAPCPLYKPAQVTVQYENLALSLAHLKMQLEP